MADPIVLPREYLRQYAESQELRARSFALRVSTLGVLETARAHVEASRLLLDRARALGRCLDDLVSGIPSIAASVPVRPPRVAPTLPHGCCFDRCAHASPFQPIVSVDRGERHTIVDLPVRVCEEHRPDLDALLRSEAVRDWLHWKLGALGTPWHETVRVLFEVAS